MDLATYIVCLMVVIGDGDDPRLDRDMCGRNSISVVAAFVQKNQDRKTVDQLLSADAAPYSFAELERAARELGLRTYLASWSSKSQARFDCPGILHVRARPDAKSPDHFVALLGTNDSAVCIVDFPSAPSLVPRNNLLTQWEGDVLYIEGPDGTAIDSLIWHHRWQTIRFLVGVCAAVVISGLVIGWFRRWLSSRAAASIRSNRIVLWSLAVGSVLGVITLICGMLLRQQGPRPSLIAENPILQIDGKQAQAEKLPVTFRLRNVSHSPVRLTSVTSSCICLAAEDIVGRQIRPGEIGEFGSHGFVARNGPRFSAIERLP